MFWIASKLLYAWNWIVDEIAVKRWMWAHRHRSKEELLQDAIEILEAEPAGNVVHEAHEILTRIQGEFAAAPSVEQKGSEK